MKTARKKNEAGLKNTQIVGLMSNSLGQFMLASFFTDNGLNVLPFLSLAISNRCCPDCLLDRRLAIYTTNRLYLFFSRCCCGFD
jgi:hypothetical protein